MDGKGQLRVGKLFQDPFSFYDFIHNKYITLKADDAFFEQPFDLLINRDPHLFTGLSKTKHTAYLKRNILSPDSP